MQRRLTATSEAARLAVAAVVALALACVLALASGTVPVSSLVTPGALGPSAEVIASDFGREVLDPNKTGYDGQQIYAIAREFPDLDAASAQLDVPAYRLLRILVPAAASVAPAGAPTVVALLVLNVLGIGAATYASARLLERKGARPIFALPAVAVLLLGVASTTVGPVAWGLALVGLHLAVGGRHTAAVAALALAALSRETASAAAVGVGAGLVLQGVPIRKAALYLLPGASALAWYLALQQLVPGSLPSRFALFDFVHLQAGQAAIAGVVAALGLFSTFVWRDEPAMAVPAMGFTIWMLGYTTDVLDPVALLRVNALPIVLGVMAIGRLLSSRPGDVEQLTARATAERPPVSR